MSTSFMHVDQQIERIKRELMALGPMRPGSLTRQYRLPKVKRRPFYQISYTHQMRSHSEYVRPEHLKILRRETAAFHKFRKLIRKWIDLSLKASQMRIARANYQTSSQTVTKRYS